MNCVRLWINEQSPITMVEFVVFVMLAGFFFFVLFLLGGWSMFSVMGQAPFLYIPV